MQLFRNGRLLWADGLVRTVDRLCLTIHMPFAHKKCFLEKSSELFELELTDGWNVI